MKHLALSIATLLIAVACNEPSRPTAPGSMRVDLALGPSAFTITDLGTLGGANAEAWAINDVGQVVGWSHTSSDAIHAFLWTRGRGMQDLGNLGGDFSFARGINNHGHVAGVSRLASGVRHAFLWTPSTGMRDLGTLGGFSRAHAINELDQVVGLSMLVGNSFVDGGPFHAFLWDPQQGMTDLTTFGHFNSWARAINNRQQIVGILDEGTCPVGIAFLWSSLAGLRTLAALGSADPCGGGFAYDVNDAGEVVGQSENNALVFHAFRWTASGGAVDLGALSGTSAWSAANGVNEGGQIVGASALGADPTIFHAFVWLDGAGMQDLGVFPGDAASSALAINSRGQIVGIGTTTTGGSRAVLWTPAAPVP